MNRRTYLGALGAAAAGTVAGCSFDEEPTEPGPGTDPPPGETTRAPTPTAEPTFSEVVDVAAETECDPTGERPCDDALEEAARDDVLLEFTEGTYRFDGLTRMIGDFRLGMVGEGDVRFVPPEGHAGPLLNVQATELLFRGIDVDVTASETTAGLKLMSDDGLVVDSVTFHGRGTSPRSPVGFALLPAVQTPDGNGVVSDVVAEEGSAIGHYKGGGGRGGIYVGSQHVGTLRVENCHLAEFGNNGIYASRTPGAVQVVGGVYRNNNPAGVRISGEGSFVDGAVVEVDMEEYTGPRSGLDGGFRPRGIVVEQGGSHDLPAGARIVNCEVAIRNSPAPAPGIHVWSSGRTLSVENSRVSMDVPASAVKMETRDGSAGGGPRWVRVENSRLETGASDDPAVDIIDGSASEVRTSVVSTGEQGSVGIRFVNSYDCRIVASRVSAPEYPIVTEVVPHRLLETCPLYVGGDARLESGSFEEVPEERWVREPRVGTVQCFSPEIESIGTSDDEELVRIALLAGSGGDLFWRVLSSE